MTRPFVDSPPSEPKLYLCSFCNSWQWTDQGHSCHARGFWSTERAFAVAIAFGCVLWVLIIASVLKATR